jgi:hypothetical protein
MSVSLQCFVEEYQNDKEPENTENGADDNFNSLRSVVIA